MGTYVPAPRGAQTKHISLKFKKKLRKKGLGRRNFEELAAGLAPRLSAPAVHVAMAQSKGLAYVSFACTEDAVIATEEWHGKPHEAIMGGRVYASYMECLTPGEAETRRSGIPDVASTAHVTVPGLSLIPEFVSEAAEADLIAVLGSGPWERLIARHVRHFGYRFNYKTRRADVPAPRAEPAGSSPESAPCAEGHESNGACDALQFPPCVVSVADAIAALPAEVGVGFSGPPDQMTVNQYKPGQGISPHVDTHSAFGDGLLSLTLGSGMCLLQCMVPTHGVRVLYVLTRRGAASAGVTMTMRHPDGSVKYLWLPRRSLLVLTGAARYQWTHGITCRKTDVVNGQLVRRGTRLSATFRKVLPPDFKCHCAWPDQCDSQLAPEHVSTLESKAPPQLEVEHVHQLYGAMSCCGPAPTGRVVT